MALDKLVDSTQLDSDLTSVANAIRTKGGTSASLAFPSGFVSAIGDISGGGNLGTKTITANDTYDASDDNLDGYSQVTVSVPASAVDTGAKSITANGNGQDVVGYATVNVSVPNTYAAGDEGKVVSSGALVSQTSDTVTANDTYDTTLINSLTVNVGGGGTDYFSEYIQGDITSYSSNEVTVIETGRLRNSKLTSINFPNLTEIKEDGCYGADITTTYYPKLETIGTRGLRDALCQYFVLPVFRNNGGDAFRGRSSPTVLLGMDIGTAGVDSPSTLALTGMATYNGNMATLILRYSSIVKLAKWDVLPSRFGNNGAGGTVYIPQSLYNHLGDGTASDYKAASNWSTYEGYGTITWAKIEGSQYENYYIDGTAIPSV